VTLTKIYSAGLLACQSSTSETITPVQGGGCCPTGIAAGNLLGAAGTTTILAPGTYSGSYRVLGDLLLTNGSYALTPGTIFYVDGQASKSPQRQVTGASITLGANASLVLDGATLTASGSTTACPMWRGLVLNHQSQGPNGTYRLIMRNNSTISHALCAIDVEDSGNGATGYTGTSNYLLDNSTFAHNLTHVRDVTYHPGTQPSLITNCTFNSEPAQMHFPYEENTTTGDKYYTYQALLLLPNAFAQSPAGITIPANAIEVQRNTINQAVYGIVNNQYDRGAVLIEGNYLNKIFQTGIWTVNTYSNQGTSLPAVSNNFIGVNAYPPQNTDQIDPTATVFGIVGEDPHQPNAFVGNRIAGDKTTGTKPQVGLSIRLQASASGNFLENLNEGIQTSELDGSEIFDNSISNCDDAFVVQPSPNGLYNLNRLGCNTFSQPSSAPGSRGIVVQQDAFINDIGSFSSPAGNRFDGVGTGIYNDNVNTQVTYYQTASSQEAVTTLGPGGVTVITRGRLNLNSYCANQGATSGNGVNQFRVAAPSASYIAALMDSVRRQVVPAVRYRDYLYEVLSYHASAQQLPALETWWTTLAVTNASAYRTVGRYLLQAYDQQPTTAAAAQRVVAGLQVAAVFNTELAAQLKLRTVLRHLPQTMPRLVAADSTVLRTLAWLGTSVAAAAGRWLRYYHPRIPLPATVPALRAATAARRKLTLAESGATLGAAYPNPAQTEVTITCQLAQADQVAELRFTNLLTGKVALVVLVEGTGTERRQRVALNGLAAGQYAYQLVANGQLVATPQKLMVNP
jgi:hypothetical protein